MATIKDVAKTAGVSVGSVSHYLNGSVPVSASKAERIQRAIDALDYRVDWGARALRLKKTRSIGLVIPDISNPFYAELARVVEHTLWDHGFQTFLCDSAHDPAREQSHLINLASRRVDGVLIIYTTENNDLVGLTKRLELPIVFLDRSVAGQPSVATDNDLGGQLAARHLLELGHRHIGALVGDSHITNMHHRMRGFTATLSNGGYPLSEALTLYGAQDLALGQRVPELMALIPRPTALFATNDIVAIGAWQTLLELGFRIPQEVSLIGFDNIEMSRLLSPPLTSVAQNIAAVGRGAAELLLEQLTGEPTPDANLVIPPRLVVRASTAPMSALLQR